MGLRGVGVGWREAEMPPGPEENLVSSVLEAINCLSGTQAASCSGH